MKVEHSIPCGIAQRLKSNCVPVRSLYFPCVNAKTRTYKFKASLSGSPVSAVRSISFCSGFMPLIVFCLSYPVSVSFVGAADLNLRRASTLAIADWLSKIPGRAYCPVRRFEPVVEQQLGLEGALVGRRLGTVVYASIDASSCSGL